MQRTLIVIAMVLGMVSAPRASFAQKLSDDACAQWRDDGPWAKRVKALRAHPRAAAGRAPTPSAACLDSQSVKTTELGGPARG